MSIRRQRRVGGEALELRAIEPEVRSILLDFFQRVPEGDRTFFNEDVLDPEVLTSFANPRDGEQRFILLDDDGLPAVGWLGLMGGVGWSSHVCRLSVVVDPARRGAGLGR